jgi:hypothetical protein
MVCLRVRVFPRYQEVCYDHRRAAMAAPAHFLLSARSLSASWLRQIKVADCDDSLAASTEFSYRKHQAGRKKDGSNDGMVGVLGA